MRPLKFLVLAVVVATSCSEPTPVGNGDSGTDAGGMDSGTDAGKSDSGFDAGADAGFDAGRDGGFDAGADAGFDGGVDAGLTTEQLALLAARPYRMVVPPNYDGGASMPFVVLLHGYGATGAQQDLYFGLSALGTSRGFLLATPDGTLNIASQRFWNATDACCDFASSGVDDVKYLTAILDDVSLRYRVDPKRIFFMGHSNGGFMSHRMACELSPRIAGIMSLAGANWKDAGTCQPTQPLAVLQVHGTLDSVIAYAGGTTSFGGAVFPGAVETMQAWAARMGCSSNQTSAGADLNLDLLVGNETVRTQWAGCSDAGVAQLWTIQGGSHLPTFTSQWPDDAYDFLMAHPKP